MKNIEEIQRMFTLFKVGDVVNGTIIAANENGIKVKTDGGCFGNVIGIVPSTLTEGCSVEIESVNPDKGIFKLTENFLFDKVKQNALVCFAGPQAIVVEFTTFSEVYGVYHRPDEGMPAELQNLKDGDLVIASGLKKDAAHYTVEKLERGELLSKEVYKQTKKNNAAPLKDWTEEDLEETCRLGSLRNSGRLELGKIYSVTPLGFHGNEVQFPDGQTGNLDKPFPQRWHRAFARVTFISKDNRLSAQLIPSKADEQPVEGSNLAVTGKNKFRNNDVYFDGINSGSLRRAGGYWLGYNYRFEVKDGAPYFVPTNKDPQNVLDHGEAIVANGDCPFKNGDYVRAEIIYIRRIRQNDFIFTVRILEVL